MRPTERAHAVVALALAASVASSAAAQPPPAGLPAHEMLEDPLNRAFRVDELEAHDGDDLRWDARVWVGRTFDRLALRTEGERVDGATRRAEAQLVWTHAIARWWEVVAGARRELEPGRSRSSAVFGIQGLAPYRFDVEATVFVGEGGAAAARFEGAYELAITPRLILEPKLELDWHARADPEREVGSGWSSAEAALRLRYEIRREVAPYVGLVRERRIGGTADVARRAGVDPDDTSLVLGLRLRF